MDALAAAVLRAVASMSAMVCSAADTTLESGALHTMMPRSVAASRSMLSTPTPARPIILSLVPASMTSRVTVVAERTMSASYSGIISTSSSGVVSGLNVTS